MSCCIYVSLLLFACSTTQETELESHLKKWLVGGISAKESLMEASRFELKTANETELIVRAVEELRNNPAKFTAEKDTLEKDSFSPLQVLSSLFLARAEPNVRAVLQVKGIPLLRKYVDEHLEKKQHKAEDIMFVLKTLAMFTEVEDIYRIAQAARKPIYDGNLWSEVFSVFDKDHPQTRTMVDALRTPLPKGFVAVAYLDMANLLCRTTQGVPHPFNNEEGIAVLKSWLTGTEESRYSFGVSACASFPYLIKEWRDPLVAIAKKHPDISVRMENAWAQGQAGEAEGIERLVEWCHEVKYSSRAVQYLTELKQEFRIPEKCKEPDFKARADLAEWLAHPSELGKPPESIDIMDSRTLVWPPTNDQRKVWLIKYSFRDSKTNKMEEAVGMVGSVTFVLYGTTNAKMPAEDLYGLHCWWELYMKQVKDVPPKPSAEHGRKLLREANPNRNF